MVLGLEGRVLLNSFVISSVIYLPFLPGTSTTTTNPTFDQKLTWASWTAIQWIVTAVTSTASRSISMAEQWSLASTRLTAATKTNFPTACGSDGWVETGTG